VIDMLPVFKEYLDNFYLAISGIWCLSQEDVRERLLKGRSPSVFEPSLPEEKPVLIDMYLLSKLLPTAPFSNEIGVNHFIELQGRLVVIGSYDWLKESTDLSRIYEKPPLIQLFKCLRDAAAHDNHFQIKDRKIKVNFPLKWRNKELSEKDDGQVLFSRWMALGDIEYLLQDVSVSISGSHK